VLAQVKECVAQALDLPVESVKPSDRLIGDLGAESIDLLDLVFQLEQRFGVSLSPRDIEERTRRRLNGAPTEVDGIYTPQALAELRRALPEVPAEELTDGLTVAALPRTFRVATMAGLVCRVLEGEGE
jgi:acyl carrier protein